MRCCVHPRPDGNFITSLSMHIDRMSNEVQDFLTAANALQWKKNADYHPDKIAMFEILGTAFETNITVEQDLWARVRKQMSALRRFVIDGHTESESPRSRMVDIAVYMGMLAFWIDNKYECIKDVADFVHRSLPCEFHGGMKGVATCVTTGTPKMDRCERCQFLQWLRELEHDADPHTTQRT